MFYVYILKSEKDDKLYVGYTNDLEKREDMLKIQGYAMGGVKRRIANSLKA